MSELNTDPPASEPNASAAAPVPAEVAAEPRVVAAPNPQRDPQRIATLSQGTPDSPGIPVKWMLPAMRACNEKDAKGKICAGHLKRWYRATPDVVALLGSHAELYRCSRCRAIYVPGNAQGMPPGLPPH